MEIVFGLFGAGLLIVLLIFADSYHQGEQKEIARKREAQRRQALELHESQIALVKSCVAEHEEALLRVTRRVVSHDAYGNPNYDRFHKEVAYFFDNIVAQRLEPASSYNREYWYGVIGNIIGAKVFDDEVIEPSEPSLDGVDYERSIGSMLAKAGFAVRYTPASGDQGVDVIAERGSERIAIQCKNYASAVGNDAVQQVHAGAAYHGATRALVVAPSTFTRSAQDLARTLGVACLHHDDLLSNLSTLNSQT
jgi:restriction system protein